MVSNAIEVSGLTRRFKTLTAVDNVSFSVREGEIFGFLGPNGAGKTTTINMLTTVLRPTSGRARVCDNDVASAPRETRRCIGLVPQEYTADEDLSGLENILLCAELYDVPKAEARRRATELLDLVQLNDAMDRRVETYSGGMRRRLELACGLINHPRVLFLDEPTLGLDVQTRAAVWQYIRTLKEKYKMTLFMTTHYLEEADMVCDRIAIIDHGRIVVIDSPENLKASLGGDIIEIGVTGGPTEHLTASLRQIPTVREVTIKDSGYRVKVINGEETAPKVIEVLQLAHAELTRISLTKPTLDEVYLEKTGRSMREEEGSSEEAISRFIRMRRARR